MHLAAVLSVVLVATVITPMSPPRNARTFRVGDGLQQNVFFQSPRFVAHTLVRGGPRPRILVATPAGNSGVGLWFRGLGRSASQGLALAGGVRSAEREGVSGVAFTVHGPAALDIDRVLLDSVRALRAEEKGEMPGRNAVVREARAKLAQAAPSPERDLLLARLAEWLAPRVTPGERGGVVVERQAIAGARYRLELDPLDGTRIESRPGGFAIRAGPGGSRLRVRAFVDRKPLSPLPRVLAAADGREARTERKLGFLAYREAFLAGSWQYLTYFGRDTLIAARLLGPRLTTEAHGAALASVLDRVSPRGEVAHEESVGDQAALERLEALAHRLRPGTRITGADLAALEKPVYDYKMVDGEYLLPPLVDDFAARATPAELRGRLTPDRIDALARVLTRIADQTAPFAKSGAAKDLVHLRTGLRVGNWRDSEAGLGLGRTPLDVNAYLAPAALEASARMLDRAGFPRQELLAALERSSPAAAALFGSARALSWRAALWHKAEDAFMVRLAPAQARARLAAYLAGLPAAEREALARQKLWSGVSVGEAASGKAAPELDQGVRFAGLSLDHEGQPVPVLSSDVAFQLFYGRPERAELLQAVRTVFQPFPVGLATPVGLVVANPAYSARAGDTERFAPDKYHGAVMWGWPLSMVRKGLRQQLARFAGDAEVEQAIRRALGTLEAAERSTADRRDAELWSWTARGGRIVAVPFGQSRAHETEGNALQLWSAAR